MTFEEFFIKKRIDLPALEKAEPSLFSEFKTHFKQMGERSFDHTKKYWFNKLRRQYHLAPEIKPEKVHVPNPLAEQTITESLSETIEPKAEPKLGFVPKFKAAGIAKPSVEEEKPPAVEESLQEKPAPKLGFVPKFKAAAVAKPGVEGEKKEETHAGVDETTAEKPSEASPPKPVYKPRFNMKNIPPKAGE
jgi:hypothetical protein